MDNTSKRAQEISLGGVKENEDMAWLDIEAPWISPKGSLDFIIVVHDPVLYISINHKR